MAALQMVTSGMRPDCCITAKKKEKQLCVLPLLTLPKGTDSSVAYDDIGHETRLMHHRQKTKRPLPFLAL
jgi:hypothetical protein